MSVTRQMSMKESPLRLLAIQTSSELTPEARVLLSLLRALPAAAARRGAPVEVLLIQGVDCWAGTKEGYEAAAHFRTLPGVRVHAVNVGKLGQPGTGGLARAMKVRDLVALRLDRGRMIEAARRFRPDIVYSAQQLWDLRLAAPLARALDRPRVVHLHYTVGPWLGRDALQALRDARMVIGVSGFIRDDAIRHGVPAERTRLLYNSIVAPELPASRDAAKSALRAEFGLPNDALVVGIVARLFENKGQVELLEAMLPILRRDRRVHLLLVGSEYPKPHGLTERLTETARASGVLPQVHLPGYRGDVPRILDGLDVFAHPSRSEPFSLAILEAMAHELPVVAWREGGPAEIIVDGQTGILVAPMDIDGLTGALDGLLGDGARRVALGKAGRERALETFNPVIAGDGFLDALRQVKDKSDSDNRERITR